MLNDKFKNEESGELTEGITIIIAGHNGINNYTSRYKQEK